MPTYQYACTECGHAFEQFQSFSDDALTVCPECDGRLRKVFNAVGVVFKGSGFYRTDSRGKDSSATPATASTSSDSSTKSSSGSSTGGSSSTGSSSTGSAAAAPAAS
ncbi:MAG TPA: FmdB family zinc ribbon protein [Nocardioides sp.]|nr:FmdB family zinc ribbon protein [Nocardioides sp.]